MDTIKQRGTVEVGGIGGGDGVTTIVRVWIDRFFLWYIWCIYLLFVFVNVSVEMSRGKRTRAKKWICVFTSFFFLHTITFTRVHTITMYTQAVRSRVYKASYTHTPTTEHHHRLRKSQSIEEEEKMKNNNGGLWLWHFINWFIAVDVHAVRLHFALASSTSLLSNMPAFVFSAFAIVL